MPDGGRALNNKAIEQGNTTRSTTAMLETLQRTERTDGAAARAVWPAALVLDNEYCDAAQELLAHASSEVRLCAYAWRWYANEPEIGIQKLNTALYRLRERGVKVRALVDTETQRLMFRELGFDTRSVINTRMLHTKAIGVDNYGLLIGSHNLTKRANTDNYEMSVLNYEFQVIDAYNTYFDKLWNSRG